MNLPYDFHLAAIGKYLRAFDLYFAYSLPDPPLEYSEGNSCKILFFYGQIDQRGFGVVFCHV